MLPQNLLSSMAKLCFRSFRSKRYLPFLLAQSIISLFDRTRDREGGGSRLTVPRKHKYEQNRSVLLPLTWQRVSEGYIVPDGEGDCRQRFESGFWIIGTR